MWQYRTNLRDGSAFSCREAGPEDIASIRAMRCAMALEGAAISEVDEVRSADFIRQSLERGNVIRLLACVDDQCVGEAVLRRGLRRATRHVANLSFAVVQNFRGRGVGHALVNATLDACRSHPRTVGVRKLELAALASNIAALRLYESHGFEREGLRRMHIARGGADRQRFEDVILLGLFIPFRHASSP